MWTERFWGLSPSHSTYRYWSLSTSLCIDTYLCDLNSFKWWSCYYIKIIIWWTQSGANSSVQICASYLQFYITLAGMPHLFTYSSCYLDSTSSKEYLMNCSATWKNCVSWLKPVLRRKFELNTFSIVPCREIHCQAILSNQIRLQKIGRKWCCKEVE